MICEVRNFTKWIKGISMEQWWRYSSSAVMALYTPGAAEAVLNLGLMMIVVYGCKFTASGRGWGKLNRPWSDAYVATVRRPPTKREPD